MRDDWTAALIDQLPDWRDHGINSLALWLQGTAGGYARAIDPENPVDDEPVLVRSNYDREEIHCPYGRTSGARIIERTRQISAAARELAMVVIVGVVYKHALREDDHAQALARIVERGAGAFADLDNVIVNVWNEPLADGPHQSPRDIERYLAASKGAAPGRPVGTGYMDLEQNRQIGSLSAMDLILMDAGRDLAGSVRALECLKEHGKPVINVESFGGRGNGYIDVPPETTPLTPCAVDFAGWRRLFGVWRDQDYTNAHGRPCAGRRSYLDLIDHVGKDGSRQSHLLVHVAGWFQGASRVERPDQIGPWQEPDRWECVFHRGTGRAAGTPSDPGIGWLLDAVGAARSAGNG
jgi:hypothetical protein